MKRSTIAELARWAVLATLVGVGMFAFLLLIGEEMEKPRDFDPFGHAGLSPLATI